MLARLRALLLKTPVLVALGLFLAYLLFAWFAFNPLAKWGAEKYIASKTGHRLTLGEARFDPFALRLTLRDLRLTEPDTKPLAAFKELVVDFEAMSLLRWAYTFDAIRLTAPQARLALLGDGRLNWSAFIDAFKDEEEEEDKGLPRLLIRRFELSQGRLDLADETLRPAFTTHFQPLDLALDDLSTLPEDKGAYQIAARSTQGASWRWRGDLQLKPVAVSGAFSVEGIPLPELAPYLEGRLRIAPPAGQASLATAYRVTYADKRLGLVLDRLGAKLEGLALRGRDATEPALTLERIELKGGRFDLDRRRLDLAAIEVGGGRVALTRRADGRLDITDWLPPAAAAKPSGTAPATPPRATAAASPKASPTRPWTLGLGRFQIADLALHYRDEGFVTPLAVEVDRAGLGFSAQAGVGDGPPQASLKGLGFTIGPLRVRSAARPEPLFVLAGIEGEGGALDLAAHTAELARLTLSGGQTTAVRRGDGRIVPLDALRIRPRPAAAPAGRPAAGLRPAAEATWAYRLGQAALRDFRVSLRDEAVRPAAGLTVQAIDATLDGLSQDLGAPVPVKLSLAVKEGGRFSLQGKLIPAKAQIDAQLRLAGLSLLPAQPYLGEAANLRLVSGRASSQGRLRLRGKFSYAGGFAVDDLVINEVPSGERFLAWHRLASNDLVVTPDSLTMDEARLEGLGAKLVIAADKSVNLKTILKPQPLPAGPLAPPSPAKAAAPARDFRLAVDRLRVSEGELDFADLSLALPFGARIHHLAGAVDAISAKAGSPAQLELDGRVDDYGLMRAAGQIDLVDPTAMTDIRVIFRNVEMTRLTPYSATFAGRRIASGKLNLDLQYKIKARQLEGENQIIMDKLTLGERVESPTAKNLPLDLAIAILEDADGRIDLGLPVSGSLDDPEFSYGRIIWKAIVNVITKIVTAPFRALGKLLGVGGEQLENVIFDAGEATLLPPEREKLKLVAQALAKRPGLALSVQGVFDAQSDGLAIRDRRLRLALAEAMGRKLAPGEDPGPVSTASPKAQEALEKLYASRQGEAALKTLVAKFRQANPEPPPKGGTGKLISRLSGLFKGKEPPLSDDERRALQGADLHALIYQRLLDSEEVSAAQLNALGAARGEAVAGELRGAGVPDERLSLEPPGPVTTAGREVAIKLTLSPARKPAPAPPPGAAPQPAN